MLGIDLGRRRTGLALSDPHGVTCTPFAVLHEGDECRLIDAILLVAMEQGVERIVMGLPRPLSGGTNRQVEEVISLTARLTQRATVPVVTWDERFTSKLAEQGRSGTGAQDAVAACYMLQSYLDSQTVDTEDV